MFQVQLSGAECFMALPGDLIAFMNEHDQSPVGYLFKPGISVQFYSLNDTFPQINEAVAFDTITLPYEFAVQAVIDNGLLHFHLLLIICK